MKYKSEIYEALHEETIANFRVGAVSEAELREFEKICFVQEDEPAYEAEKDPSAVQPVTASYDIVKRNFVFSP